MNIKNHPNYAMKDNRQLVVLLNFRDKAEIFEVWQRILISERLVQT